MLAKILYRTRVVRSINRCSTSRFFSAEAEAETAAQTEVPEPTKEELEAGRIEWGIKYDDECLKFEKEWEIIANKVQTEQ